MGQIEFSIRRAVPDDAAGFCALMGNEAVFPNVLMLPFPTEAAWRERIAAKSNEGDLQLVALANSEIIASAGLMGSAQMRRRHACNLGIAVAPQAQGKGVGSALMQALLDYADQWTSFLRIELTVFVGNEVAIALYRKFGFENEGLHRGYALRFGKFQDVITMARLRPNQPLISNRTDAP